MPTMIYDDNIYARKPKIIASRNLQGKRNAFRTMFILIF